MLKVVPGTIDANKEPKIMFNILNRDIKLQWGQKDKIKNIKQRALHYFKVIKISKLWYWLWDLLCTDSQNRLIESQDTL